MKISYALILAALLVFGASPGMAQTIGYAEAIDRLAKACGKDIDRYCRTANLGGGRVLQCLVQNQSKISGSCRATAVDVGTLLQKREEARANVMKLCDADIRRLCPGVKPGDGNLLECFYKAEKRTSPQCQQAVTDAGYR
jgi:OOP family OmpA-OmpF porin